MTEADTLVAEIAAAAKEQAQGIRQVGSAMTQMDKVTQGNASSAEQTSSAAEELNGQAKLLQETVEQLRTLIESTANPDGGRDTAPVRRTTRRIEDAGGSAVLTSGTRLGGRVAEVRRQLPQIVMPDDHHADGDDASFRNF